MSWGTTQFTSGPGLGLVSRFTLALIMTEDAAIRDTLWNLAAVDAPLDEVLDGLSEHGLRNLPSFAIVRFEDTDAARVVVRGDARVALVTALGPHGVEAGGVRTWVEELVNDVVSVDLILNESWSSATTFHVLAGAVPASTLSRIIAATDVHADLATGGWSSAVPSSLQRGFPPRVVNPDATLMSSDIDELRIQSVASTVSKPTAATEPSDGDDYDFIFGRTIARSVQAAAVHHDPESVPDPPASREPSTPSLQPPVVGRPPPAQFVSPATVGGVLIDRIPPPGPTPSPSSDSSQLGDHDGRTISKAQLAQMRGGVPASSAAEPPATGPALQAILCVAGHPNPLQAGQCRTCGAEISSGNPVTVQRPTLGLLRFSNGLVIMLDRPQLIGRNPKIEGHVGGELPSIVKLDQLGQGLSRRHAAIHIDGWQVLLEDLNSANGTIVTLPGRPARRLHAGEPAILEPGAFVDLGGEVSFVFEGAA